MEYVKEQYLNVPVFYWFLHMQSVSAPTKYFVCVRTTIVARIPQKIAVKIILTVVLCTVAINT